MRILVSSYTFHPSIGGIETVSDILCRQFVRLGHDVKLVTRTPGTEEDRFPFEVIRRPRMLNLRKLINWCDVYLQNNISLELAWPVLVSRKPWLVTHQTWISRADGQVSWKDRLKRRLLKSAIGISISKAVAEHAPTPTVIIGNPYREDIFRPITGVVRDQDLLFVGRLVSDKGVDLLIDAMGQLKAKGLTPQLSLVGSGPEESFLRTQVERLKLHNQITFMGSKSGDELARIMNAHRIMIVPSRWNEPFGVVSLEGIACGCVIVGSEGGGLKDAIGSCGLTFPNNNSTGLAVHLEHLLTGNGVLEKYRQFASEHLNSFKGIVVAQRYLRQFEEALAERE